MFFVVSKLFDSLFQPATLVLVIGVVGVAFGFGRFARLGRVLAAGAILALAFLCFSPVSSMLLRPLEDRFPRPRLDGAAPTGIVVLGGAMDADVTAARGEARRA